MEEKPLISNLIMNFIRTLLNLLFPVITFSYASRVLGDKGIGIVNYTDSIVRYLILIGGSGISYYAMREAARVREKRELLAQRVGELFCLNLALSGIAYLILFGLLIAGAGKEYAAVLLVQSGIVFFNALGMEWFYNALEEYRYIAIRTAVFQIVACVLLFFLVREEQDYLLYALIMSGAVIGMQAVNFVYVRKAGIPLSIKGCHPFREHWQGAKYVFWANLAISVYVHIDKTMLGNLCSMEAVGLYSAAHYIIQAVAGLLTCMTNVLLPRVSFYLGEGRGEKAEALLQKTGSIIVLVVIPSAVGTVCVGKSLLLLLSGETFVQAFPALAVLAVGMLFSVFNNYYIWQVMIPYRREKEAFYGTFGSAVVNIVLNFLWIPVGGMLGAAAATAAAEAALFLLCRVWIRRDREGRMRGEPCGNGGGKKIFGYVLQALAASGVGIILSSFLIDRIVEGHLGGLLMKVLVSLLLYPVVLWFLGNETIRLAGKKMFDAMKD